MPSPSAILSIADVRPRTSQCRIRPNSRQTLPRAPAPPFPPKRPLNVIRSGHPNKQKLTLSKFHEASLALRKAYNYTFPDKKQVHIHPSCDAKLAERVTGSHA